MCGIIGSFNSKVHKSVVATGVMCLENRGRDGTNVLIEKNFSIGHTLHAIVGRVKQPLIGKGTLITNCEIYNWKELKAEYSLDGENGTTGDLFDIGIPGEDFLL